MNKAQLIGYLGKDPEIFACSSGEAVARLRLATHTRIKEPPPGTEHPYRTTWHTVKIWGKQRVERLVGDYIKGSHVLVEGRLQYHSYVNKQGQTRFVAEINADRLVNLDR